MTDEIRKRRWRLSYIVLVAIFLMQGPGPYVAQLAYNWFNPVWYQVDQLHWERDANGKLFVVETRQILLDSEAHIEVEIKDAEGRHISGCVGSGHFHYDAPKEEFDIQGDPIETKTEALRMKPGDYVLNQGCPDQLPSGSYVVLQRDFFKRFFGGMFTIWGPSIRVIGIPLVI